MRITALVVSSALLMVSNAFADTVLNVKALTKAIASHQRIGGDKGSFVIVYGGQDISRGNVRIMNTLDRTVLAG